MKMLNKTLHNIMFAVLFVVLLCVISFCFQGLGQLFQNNDPYKVPRGHAVKVFHQGDEDQTTLTMVERLAVFYIYGEN